MKAYKGFNKDMTCRGFQYKEGGEYKTNEAKVCDCGFHACENPIECLRYYEPHKSVYHEVELDGEIDRQHDGDTKVAATKIKIGAATAGDRGAATSRGSVAVGENGVGTVRATNPKIKGGVGAILTIAKESKCNYDIVAWQSFVVDGKEYKPDTWYTLRDGKVVEVAE